MKIPRRGRFFLSILSLSCIGWANYAFTQSPGSNSIPGAQPNSQIPIGAVMQSGLQQQINQPPFPPLSPALEEYLDKVLSYWQQSTSKIERYQCKFKRWQYDPTQVTQKQGEREQHYTQATGVIRFMNPDKGMFQVEEIKFYRQQPDGSFQYQAVEGQYGDWWICDGKKVHLYDRTEKKAKIYPLPAQMQGSEVFNSPLPFVFGVDAAKLKARYWIRPLEPPKDDRGVPNPNLILLEVYPKSVDDAVNYHHVTIYLDVKEFLPLAIEIALTNWTPQQPHREFFQFEDRVVNASLLAKVSETLFRQAFIPAQPPKDWKVEELPITLDVPVKPPVDLNQQPLRANNPNALPPR